MSIEIRELGSENEFEEAYGILSQLYDELEKERFDRDLRVMRDGGYQLFGLYENGTLRAVAGVNIVTNFSNGKHVYLYDLVTDRSSRSQGYGSQLLQFIERWGDERDCSRVKLITGIAREEAHKFYEEKVGYDRTGYVFKGDLR